MDSINLFDALASETKIRPEYSIAPVEIEQLIEPIVGDFSQPIIPIVPFNQSVEIEDEEEEETTAEESAESLITIIDVIQSSIFTFIGSKKITKKYPQEVMDRFIAVDTKDMMGDELDDEEKRLLDRYKQFERRYDKLAGEMPFSEVEREKLMPAALVLCKRNKIKINGNVAFVVAMVDVLARRASKVFGL
jgi:hypothetical protein